MGGYPYSHPTTIKRLAKITRVFYWFLTGKISYGNASQILIIAVKDYKYEKVIKAIYNKNKSGKAKFIKVVKELINKK